MKREFLVCSKDRAGRILKDPLKQGVTHVISLGSDRPLGLERVSEQNKLVLTFEDRIGPDDGPKDEDIQELVSFIQKNLVDKDFVCLVHCYAGISRSVAAWYIAQCMVDPAERKDLVLQKMYDSYHKACPNIKMVQIADRLLGLNGELLGPVEKHRHAPNFPYQGSWSAWLEGKEHDIEFFYPHAGNDAEILVQQAIEKYRCLPADQRKKTPLKLWLLGDNGEGLKISKEEAKYKAYSKECWKCEHMYFKNKQPMCEIVEGIVSGIGGCRYFSEKPR